MNAVNIPGYELLNKLGEGGMAAVWKARQTRLNRLVAIKILRARISEKPGEMERFRHEAMAAANLSHANIVQVIDAGECDGHAYTVMEYIPGCTLADWLSARGALDERQALDIASDVASALAYGWNQHRMVHHDIKPENILVHEAGTVKLADLGIAQMAGFTDVQVEDGFALGTPQYMSPEQAMHDRKKLDCRADIYSLGATLYHMLTGRMPFQGVPMDKVLELQVTGFLPDLTEVAPQVSPATAWLVEKMMARDPAHRQPTWEAVLADLDLARSGNLVSQPLTGDGLSTVRRHPERRTPPAASRSAAPASAAASRPRSMIRLSMRDIHHIRQIREHQEGGLGRSRTVVTALAAAALAAYGYTAFFSLPAWNRARAANSESRAAPDLFTEQRTPDLPEEKPAPSPTDTGTRKMMETLQAIGRTNANGQTENPFLAKPAPRTPRPPRPVATNATPSVVQVSGGGPLPAGQLPDEAVDPAPADPAPAEPPAEEWRDPAFLQARAMLDKARQGYAAALRDRGNAVRWRQVESDARNAQTLLQGVRSLAPPEAGVGELYREATKLLFDTHQVMRTLE